VSSAEQSSLPGFQTRVEMSLARIRQFEPPEGYYLAFSGGKDSVVLLRLVEMSGVKFDAHFMLTTVDPPEVVRFVRQSYPQVQMHAPPLSMFQLIEHKKHWPPMRHTRWCCEELKEKGGEGRMVLTGVRWAESAARQRWPMVGSCISRRKRLLHPIIDWTTDDVWSFILGEAVPYCSLYDEGFDRIGCILCPAAGRPERDIERWPRFARAYRRCFDRVIRWRQANGKRTSFANGDELFEWWIRRRAPSTNGLQPPLFT